MKYENILWKLWLSSEEIKIYLDLLDYGTSNIIEISNRTGINRPAIYKTLPNLIEMGLVASVIKGKRKVFKAEDPNKLKELLKTVTTNLDMVVSELEYNFKAKEPRPNIKFLEGKNGIKTVYQDILDTLNDWDVYYRYTSRKWVNYELYPKDYNKKIDAKWIFRYVITNEAIAKTKEKKEKRDLVVIPKDFNIFDDNVNKIIYKNKVAVVDFNSLTAFIIENKILAGFEEKIFKLLFKTLKSVQS